MKIGHLFFLLATLICIGGLQQAVAQNGQYISVRDFGARGDGKTDDTKAIQAAIDYAANAGFSTQSLPGVYEKQLIYFGSAKTVFFPSGIYCISQTIKVGSYIHLLAEKSILVPIKKFVDLIDGVQGSGWQAQVEGLQFLGFKCAININTHNVDLGKIVISNCDFFNNNTAIELNAQSSLTIIRENRFFNNQIALNVVSGDKVDMFDNWITATQLRGVHAAQIINRGVLHFDKNFLVPIIPFPGAKEPAWINNYNLVTINCIRQGGEPGSFTLVNNFAEANIKYPVNPNGVIITNSDCYAVYRENNNYFEPAALRLINIPNTIVLQDLRGFVDAKLLDFTNVLNSKKRSIDDKFTNKQIVIKVENIQSTSFKHSNGTDVPQELIKFLIK